MKNLIFVLMASVMLFSCKKEEPPTPPTPTPTPIAAGGDHLFRVNSGYASMELYSTTTMQLKSTVTISYGDVNYPGNAFFYNDSTYFVKVIQSSASIYEGNISFNSSNQITHTDVIGTVTLFGNDAWGNPLYKFQ